MKFERKIILSLLTVTALSCGTVFAAETTEEIPEYNLGSEVVTASRVNTKRANTPANITVVTQDKIKKSNYSTASDALRDVPGVNILTSGTTGTSMGQDVILLNGDKRVLVMVDGRRVNTASSGNFSADWLPALDMIQRIEVLKGSGSALYGTDAVGGVVNVITKRAEDLGNTVKVRVAGGSFSKYEYGVLASGVSKEGVGVVFSARKAHQGDYKFKNNLTGNTETLANSATDTTSATLKLDKKFKNDSRLTMNLNHMLVDGGAPFTSYKFGTTDNHQRLNNDVAFRYDWNESKDNKGFVQAYRNYHHALFNSPYSYMRSDFNETKYGVEAQQNWQLTKTNALTAGIEYYDTSVENEALYESGTNSVNNKAVYIEDRWEFVPTWQLNSGFRLDKHSKAGGKGTPHLALNKKFNADSNAYFSWGRIFNAPTTDSLFWYQPGYGMYGNPNLSPETGDVYTLGTTYRTSKATTVGATIFQSDIDNAISWQYDASYNYAPVNVSNEKRRGMELTIDHKLNDKWSLNASYTYLQIKQKGNSSSDYIVDGSAKPNLYRAGIQYNCNKWVVNVTARAASGLVDRYTNASGYTSRAYGDSSYFTWDVGAQYQVNKQTKVYAQLNNINNVAYQEYSGLYSNGQARYPMPGRNFLVGVEYAF